MSKIGVLTLENRIENVINIHRKAGDVTNAEIMGVLEILKMDIYQEMLDKDDEGEKW